MTERTSCRYCGKEILLGTAQRTGGVCMPCFKGAGTDGNTVVRRLMAANIPSSQLLAALEASLLDATLKAARHAATALASETVYGFWLYHHCFEYASATVFTEAGLDKVTQRYREEGHPDQPRDALRWSPCDSPHHEYRHTEYRVADLVFSAVEEQGLSEAVTTEIHRGLLRTLWRVRGAKIFAPSVVLSMCDADHPPEEPYAYAERFCDEDTLRSFRSELGELREEWLVHCRAHIPTY